MPKHDDILAPWRAKPGEPLTAADRAIARELGDDSPGGVQRVRRARLAAGIPARRGAPRTAADTLGAQTWVVSLPRWLARDLEAVDRATQLEQLRAHLDERGTRAVACTIGHDAIEREVEQWYQWSQAARDAHSRRDSAPPSPSDQGSVKVGLGRWSREERDEIARRAAGAGIRPAVYAAEVALGGEGLNRLNRS